MLLLTLISLAAADLFKRCIFFPNIVTFLLFLCGLFGNASSSLLSDQCLVACVMMCYEHDGYDEPGDSLLFLFAFCVT